MAFTYGTISYAKDSNGNYIAYNSTKVYQIRLGYQVNSQNISNNTSNITLQLEVRSINSSYKTYGYNQTTTIDGTTLSAASFDFRSTNTWQIFGTKTFDVTHNADGSYSVEKSASFTTTASGSGRPKSGSATVQVTLPTIPRASAITVTDANIGSSTNITINKATSSFTTTIYYKASGQNSFTKIVDKTSNQVYGWTVPTSFYALIPNSKTITCQFYAETYSGSTLIGTSATVTATFTATGSPVINSCTLESVDNKTINLVGSTRMIRYISTVRATVSATAQNSATISSIKVNGSTATNGVVAFANATTYSYQVVVTDSRGYQTSGTYTITWTSYIPLIVNAYVRRNQPTDGKVNINISGNYYNDSFRKSDDTYVANVLNVYYRYKESTASSWSGISWIPLTPTISGNTYTASTQISNIDYTKQYDFQIDANDRTQDIQITGITVSKGTPVYNWDEDDFITNVNTTINKNLIVNGNLNAAKYVTQEPTNFQNDIFSNISSGGLTIMRKSGTWSSGYIPNYSAGLGWMSDQQGGFIVPGHGTKAVYVGGVSNGLVNWSDRLLLFGNTNQTDWIPQIACVSNETAPTVTYTTQRGKYCKIGHIVFFMFYIRAKITALNGTNNYALIKNLPYTPINYGFGGYGCNIGILYSAVYNPEYDMNFVISGAENGIRIQSGYGAGAKKWVVTSTNYMEVGGSGWYFTND